MLVGRSREPDARDADSLAVVAWNPAGATTCTDRPDVGATAQGPGATRRLTMRRGQVWWGDLGESRGQAPAGRRPLVIVSDDVYNMSRIATVSVVPVTSGFASDPQRTAQSSVYPLDQLRIQFAQLLPEVASVDCRHLHHVGDRILTHP
jgi:mRNA-degrading endonuclease toxin of MazEF toxin-antitoxin module